MPGEPSCRVFSCKELSCFDGELCSEIYISFSGQVYDVSSSRSLYGKSPPGPYHQLAGRECARALSTMSLDPSDVGRDDLDDISALVEKLQEKMTPAEVRTAVQKAFDDWQRKFMAKYPRIGALRRAGDDLHDSSAGESLQGHPVHSHPKFLLPESSPVEPFSEDSMELLSRKPRAYLQRKFLSPLECQTLISMILQRSHGTNFETKLRSPLAVDDPVWTPEQRELILKIETRLAEWTGCPAHPDETALVGTLTPPQKNEDAKSAVSSHLGLHVDTNAAHWRYCTAIIYLSSLSDGLRGGETVFPVALDPRREGPPSEAEERTIEAAGELLDMGFDHTDKALDASQAVAADAARLAQLAAQDLLARADCNDSGLQVTPSQGSVCIFWTRQDDGEIDRFSWHGGAPVHREPQSAQRILRPEMLGWKWTLQKFKEVPIDKRGSADNLAEFVRRTRRGATSSFG